MAEGRFVAYFRVSTDQQGRSGLGLEVQREATAAYLNGGSWSLVSEFTEVESGKRSGNRPQLAAAMEECRATGATLLIAKLDRLARNVRFISSLMEDGVPFVACDMPNATPFMLHVYAAVAEEEARAISRRTKAALAVAKAKGVALGGNRGNHARNLTAAREATASRTAETARCAAPVALALRSEGASLRAIAAELRTRRIRTPRGGVWDAAKVRSLLIRADGKPA